jgi:hypothetical protein
VDLVIYRRDWPRLLKLDLQEEETFIRKAAAQAVALADAPLTDRFSRLKGVLLPGWTERTHLFSGITVFFDDLPTDPAQLQRFHGFFRRFMDRLIAEMQRTGRNYALSIVMPDYALGDQAGPFNFGDLLGYIEAAERPTGDKLHDGRYRLNYKGTSDMTVLFLVLLSEPTSPAKKALRARLDNSEVIQGHQRVAFLESMLPVMFHPTGDKPGPLPKPRRDRLDIDLAYVEWQFGGVGFWPVPMDAVGTGADVAAVLAENTFLEAGSAALSPLCSRVCPNRSVLRLMFEGLLLLGVVSLGAYAWVCEVRRLGLKYLLYLWAGGAVTVLLGMALLSCDPDLAALRKGDYLFYGLIVALVAGGLYVTFKPRVELP